MASSSSQTVEQASLNASLIEACQSTALTASAQQERLSLVRDLIVSQGAHAWAEDEALGWSSLHYAAESGDEKLCAFLLGHGAVWNAVDHLGYTAAEVAASLNHDGCYRILFEEGVRQTVLLNLVGRLGGDGDEEDADEEGAAEGTYGQPATMNAKSDAPTAQVGSGETAGHIVLRPEQGDLANDNDSFLKSRLNFIFDGDRVERCLDADGNMVMAAWETDIMARSADVLCSNRSEPFTILNVGFGLGIIDELIQNYKPARHVIIEAHPDAVALMKEQGWASKPGVEIFPMKWEQAINDPSLGSFDAVYFDTYSQDYADLRAFFEELPNLLSGPQARFSFFHGLAGTNLFFYDVFTRVAEVDLGEMGLETGWIEMKPGVTEEEWEGVKRKYWSLDTYRLPISRMVTL